MFKYKKTLDVLQDIPRMSSKQRRRVMTELLYDEDFMKWLFQPDDIPNLTEVVTAYYTELTRHVTMKAIIDAIEYEGHREFDRSTATFLTSIANIAINNNNDLLEEVDEARRSGDLSKSQTRDVVDKVENVNITIAKLLKTARRIIKKKALVLAKESRLPKYITISAYTSVPDPKYVDTFKIGYYLNNLLSTIYSEVDENGDFERNPKWRAFFKEIFGKNNLADVATFILLEGVHRIDQYENSEDVHLCWNSLTNFALEELDESPAGLRNQMLDLYIKRLDRMFSNRAFDLRVDLRDLDSDLYPRLAETLGKYVGKIASIIKRAANL